MRVNIQKTLYYIYAALFLCTPLIMFHKTSEIYEFNKLLWIYLMSVFIVSTWIIASTLKDRSKLPKHYYVKVIGLFLLSQVLATAFSIDIHTSLYGYYGRFNGGLLSIIAYLIISLSFLVFFSKKGASYIHKILRVSVISSVLVLLWGLPSKFGYDPTCLVFTGHLNTECWTDQFVPTIRMFSTLGQPNWLAAYLGIHVCIGLYYLLFGLKDRTSKIWWSLYVFSMLLGVLFTRSRSAMLALVIVGASTLMYIFLTRRDILKNWVHIAALSGITVAIILSGIIFSTGISQIDSLFQFKQQPSDVVKIDQSLEESSRPLLTQDVTDSFTIRKNVWQAAYNLGISNPLFGTGVETFAYSFNFEKPFQHNDTSEWDFVYNKAHNEFLNYLATTGFIGLTAYLAMSVLVFVLVYDLHRNKSISEENKALSFFLLMAYTVIHITNFFGFSTTVIQVFFYLIPAWILTILFNKSNQDEDDVVEIDFSSLEPMVIGSAVVGIAGFIWVAQYLFADMAYAYGNNYRQVQEYDVALPKLYSAYNLRKEDVYEEKISQTLANMGLLKALSGDKEVLCISPNGEYGKCFEMSNAFMDRAIEGSPMNPYFYRTKSQNNFIMFQATHEDEYYTNAMESIRKARELSPTDPRLPYFQALYVYGYYEQRKPLSPDDEKALRTAGLASTDLSIKLRPQFRDAYYVKGLIQKELRDVDGARASFQFILDSFNPEDVQALKELETL